MRRKLKDFIHRSGNENKFKNKSVTQLTGGVDKGDLHEPEEKHGRVEVEMKKLSRMPGEPVGSWTLTAWHF